MRMPGWGQTLLAIGLVGLGVLTLVYGDFALEWQPVAPWFPLREVLVYATGLLELACGLGLFVAATSALASQVLVVSLLVWVWLKVPAVVIVPGMEAVWLGLGEIVVLFTGGWVLYASLNRNTAHRWLKPVTGDAGLRLARILFGLAVIPIGLSHIVYLDQTVALVPAWLPARAGWAYLTGAGHIAAGLGVLFRIVPRLAATLEAWMIGVFTLLVWLPQVVTAPTVRLNWTAFAISWVIAAGAWIVADSYRATSAAA